MIELWLLIHRIGTRDLCYASLSHTRLRGVVALLPTDLTVAA